MSDFKAGQEVTVCVQTLYEAGNPLQCGRIEIENDDRWMERPAASLKHWMGVLPLQTVWARV